MLLSKTIERGPTVFVTVSDNMTKLTDFCFKIEIQIKIRVPQGRKLLFLSQATSEGDREKRKRFWGISKQLQLLQQGKTILFRDSHMPEKEILLRKLVI